MFSKWRTSKKKNKANHMFSQWSIFDYKDLDILFFLIQQFRCKSSKYNCLPKIDLEKKKIFLM